jgi:poly-gamma-glutamate capsule biosynthesis protein CapA/YwtB (metallophosphatase superfamily)
MQRRQFLGLTTKAVLLAAFPGAVMSRNRQETQHDKTLTLFLCGDVMTGRGIDQVLPYPSDPRLHEPYVRDARRYVDIAEDANGTIPKPVDFIYIWGEILDELRRADLRIINLETSVTTSDDYERGKGINYRMHPRNIPCITAANIDCCVLANNHVLDWGYAGLAETIKTLQHEDIKTAGAGDNLEQAQSPAIMEVAAKGRVLVFSFGMPSSGVPRQWGATVKRAGVNLLTDLSDDAVQRIRAQVQSVRQPADIVVVSIHWGENWGYEISGEQIRFAHQLIDDAGIDIIHGHSSHHVKAMEVYHNKPVFYGCGDFLNDYEGIGGYEQYRDDLALMYFVTMDPVSDELVNLEMVPTQVRRFQVNHAPQEDVLWLERVLNREGKRFHNRVQVTEDQKLVLQW